VPTFVRYALPHDTIELAVWGRHLQWGYDKNPYLNGWLGWLASLFGTSGIGFYLLAQVFVVMAFWSIWRLGKEIFNPVYALIAVMMMEGCIYFTLDPSRFNDNCMELGLWAVMMVSFYFACKHQRWGAWILTGLFAGLGMMAKYYTALPLFCMFVYTLIDPQARQAYRKLPVYIGAIVAVLVIAPHVAWLMHHQWLTVRYMFIRTHSQNTWVDHVHYPFQFASAQCFNFILPILLLLLAISRNRQHPAMAERDITVSSADRCFLWVVGFGPFVITILLSVILGWRLKNEWGTPTLTLWSLLLLSYWRPRVSLQSLTRFLIGAIIVMVAWPLGDAVGVMTVSAGRGSDNFPAQAIASRVTNLWHQTYGTRLRYVVGSRYTAGYVAFYSPDKPSVLMDYQPRLSPWINMNNLHHYGAAFVQYGYFGTSFSGKRPKGYYSATHFPKSVMKQYPDLKILPLQNIPWARHKKGEPPVRLLIGFLPPEQTQQGHTQ